MHFQFFDAMYVAYIARGHKWMLLKHGTDEWRTRKADVIPYRLKTLGECWEDATVHNVGLKVDNLLVSSNGHAICFSVMHTEKCLLFECKVFEDTDDIEVVRRVHVRAV